VSATIEEGRFGLAENSGEWRQQELEQWLEQRLTKDIANFVPEHMFNVYVTVTFKNERNSVRRVTNVNLSKFGAVTSLVRVDGVKPHQGIFGKVSKLDVTVLVDDDVAPSTIAGIEAVIKNQIPIIDTHRINTNVVRMDRPSPGLAAWLKQFESVIATCLVTAIICLFLFYL